VSNKKELIDIVDEKDQVIGTATRQKIYGKKLRHRIVHALVFNQKNEMLLQLRSKSVDFLPGAWSTAAGGHVGTSENYLQAARRELFEELGIKGKLIEIGKFKYFSPSAETHKFVRFYKLVYKEPIQVTNEDVERVEYFSPAKLKKMLKDSIELHPELVKFIKEYL
jgi:isopentenyldiphosphate isomerase